MTFRRCCLLAVLLLSVRGWAESNTTMLVSGTVSNILSPFIFGQDGTNNMLVVTNAGTLITTNGAAIGYSNTQFNAGFVTGAGSRWVTRFCFVGFYGGWNRLTVSDGARVINDLETDIGYMETASNNSLLVTGSGTLFSNITSRFNIGVLGPGNSATVSNGALLQAGSVTVGQAESAVNNRLLITGTGSKLAANFLYVGEMGSYNRLEVRNGGLLDAPTADIGWKPGGNCNTAVVEGLSVWSNRLRLYVGNEGSFNSLLITNAGLVFSDLEAGIGRDSNAVGNRVLVEGAGSRWMVSNLFCVGESGASNRLEIRNYGIVACGVHAFVGDSPVSPTNAHGNSVLVEGTNTRWVIRWNLFMGRESGWNRLVVRNGGLLVNSNAYVGLGESPYPSNTVDVYGPGSVWTNLGEVYVTGAGNAAAVSNGAKTYALFSRVGSDDAFQRARISVEGSGSLWQCQSAFRVGFYGAYGDGVVAHGGCLKSGSGMIGFDDLDNGNSMVVTGNASVWTNEGSITLGEQGSSNTLVVSEGGRVYSHSGYIGSQAYAIRNTAIVTGAGSLWSCDGAFELGVDEGNRLAILDGGRLSCTNASVGTSTYATGNVVVVSGADSVWTNSGELNVGDWNDASGNGVEALTGACVVCRSLMIGTRPWCDRNFVAVKGPGSLMLAGEICVGRTGSYNRLSVENGGCLISSAADIGYSAKATGNWVRLSGAGSVWTNDGPFTVGRGGPGSVVYLQTGAVLRVASTVDVVRGTVDLSGGFLQCPRLNMGTNAVLAGVGTVQVSSAYSYGAVRVGNPFGRIAALGSWYQQDSGALHFDLAGYEPGVGYDQLWVTNGFGIAGTLTVSRATGFLPQPSNEFLLVSWGSHTSTGFSATNLPPWFDWQVFNSEAKTGLVLKALAYQTATNNVPKAWLADHGWTNNFDAAATNDADGDFVPTWEEYFAGTDPTNNKSYFHGLDIARSSAVSHGRVLRWEAVSGRYYAIEASTNLKASAWLELTNNLPGPINVWTDTVPAAGGQYRIRVGMP